LTLNTWSQTDSSQTIPKSDALELNRIVIQNHSKKYVPKSLRSVEDMAIYEGRKSELIVLDELAANLATNNARQVFSRVAGLNSWESDGAGIQLGVATRGLNPSRTAEFNTRQNGYDMSADALGYPESYYTPPTEALERIEVVRGAASLQYGTQFGGMINFSMKEAPKDKPFHIVSRQTVGSYGLWNSFNSVGGTLQNVRGFGGAKGLQYYGFYHHKQGDDWRPNSHYKLNTAYGKLGYPVHKKLLVEAEATWMRYLAKQPGGLTDVQFEEDPSQSNRSRNWFRVDWNLAAISLDYKVSSQTRIHSKTFGLLAGRDALGILTRTQDIDNGNARDLFVDQYFNYGNETRLLHRNTLLGKPITLLLGTRLYKGHLDRRQGFGDSTAGAHFSFLNPNDFDANSNYEFDPNKESDYVFPSYNMAVFAENIVYLTDRLTMTPGFRWEWIKTEADGTYDLETNELDTTIAESRSNTRHFPLFGVGVSYHYTDNAEVYGNISQNYRGVNFNDMRVTQLNFAVDTNLQDESGFNADLGWRGSAFNNILSFDVSLFLLEYKNRIGELRVSYESESSDLFPSFDREGLFRTNISDSRHIGLETFLEIDIAKSLEQSIGSHWHWTVFSNATLLDARYINSAETAVQDKKVEQVPSVLVKLGNTFGYKDFKASLLYSYTGEQFTDATNSIQEPYGINGVIPAYWVVDFSLKYKWKCLLVEGGVNNFTNQIYFSRRASGYPGPGIIPASPRTGYVTLGVDW
jgi:Fe(3+) dicitrate transport protein